MSVVGKLHESGIQRVEAKASPLPIAPNNPSRELCFPNLHLWTAGIEVLFLKGRTLHWGHNKNPTKLSLAATGHLGLRCPKPSKSPS